MPDMDMPGLGLTGAELAEVMGGIAPRPEARFQAELSNQAQSKTDALARRMAQLEAEARAPRIGAEPKAVVLLRQIVAATHSHVDGRDLLAELHPRKTLDIKRRVDGRETWFEGDWLSDVKREVDRAKAYLFGLDIAEKRAAPVGRSAERRDGECRLDPKDEHAVTGDSRAGAQTT